MKRTQQKRDNERKTKNVCYDYLLNNGVPISNFKIQ